MCFAMRKYLFDRFIILLYKAVEEFNSNTINGKMKISESVDLVNMSFPIKQRNPAC
jgi:hypothetical protein